MSRSSIERPLPAYRRERLPHGTFVPLALFLALSAWIPAASQYNTSWRMALSGLTAYTLVAQFRLWDDLEDRKHDAVQHPYRVLSGAVTLLPFWGLFAALALLNLVLLAAELSAALGWLAICAVHLVWYRLRRRRGHHLLLIKYPAIATVLALQHGATPHAPALALVYLTFCIYEVLHDTTAKPRWLNLESALWCLAALATAWGAKHRVTQLVIAVAASVALRLLLARHSRRALEPSVTRLVFLLTTVQLLNLSRGLS